jgi:hypothetical protein
MCKGGASDVQVKCSLYDELGFSSFLLLLPLKIETERHIQREIYRDTETQRERERERERDCGLGVLCSCGVLLSVL